MSIRLYPAALGPQIRKKFVHAKRTPETRQYAVDSAGVSSPWTSKKQLLTKLSVFFVGGIVLKSHRH